MPIPTYSEFIDPLLRVLAEHKEPLRSKDVYEALAQRVGLTPEERAELLPSGRQPVYKNRIGWAQDALKRSHLSSAPSRGRWLITQAGRDLLAKHSDGLPSTKVSEIANASRHTPIKDLTACTAPDGGPSRPPDNESPEERIESGLQDLRDSVAQELLDAVGQGTPEDFEKLVLDVLHAMGYGESRQALEHVGKSGDGGIDGVISLDRLGLEKVYVQAKRWKGQVGSPEVQGFMGALQLRGADKGVLITSGSVSGPAREAAQQAKGSVVLIDGQRLATLMIEYGVGVTNETLQIPRFDSDYFENE